MAIRGARYDIAFPDPPPKGRLAAVIILDEQTPERLHALARFWAAAAGRRVLADQRLSAQRRSRARQMLRVVDARFAGVTYRAIAEVIFAQHDIEPASWVGSAIRETTIRLARDGMKLVRGEYLSLLRRPRRST